MKVNLFLEKKKKKGRRKPQRCGGEEHSKQRRPEVAKSMRYAQGAENPHGDYGDVS